jgi:hypothetical protein
VNVADIRSSPTDTLGFDIVCIYYFKPPEFAIYRTEKRVLIQFADDSKEADQQRRDLSQLGPMRGEINGLIDGWRTAPDHNRLFFPNGQKLRARAERYDRAVADALQVGLEGDISTSCALLENVKQDILNIRIGWSRFEYLLMAFATVIAIWTIAMLVMWRDADEPCSISSDQLLCLTQAVHLWRGFVAGAAGAFFSIALGIRSRTILPDLYRLANLMDATLRVVVGSIGGVILVALILAQFVQFALGTSSPGHFDDLYIFIAGFVAGFTERLVPDLLAKADVRTGDQPVLPTPAKPPGPSVQAQAQPA